MNTPFKLEIRVLLSVATLLVSVHIPIYLLIDQGVVGLILYGLLLSLIIITLLTGVIKGLFSSLFILFIAGTMLLYLNRPSSIVEFQSITFPLFLLYGLLLIVVVLLAGHVHDRIINQESRVYRMENEIGQYVAIDVDTEFDNKHHMEREIQSEMVRVERYGNQFTLILLQLDYYKDFENLYGEKETAYLLLSLAQSIERIIGSTDRKFRYAADSFALLLTNTDHQSIDVILSKLSNNIKTHQLLTKNYVTLSFRLGYIFYEKDTEIREYEALFSRVESEMTAREL